MESSTTLPPYYRTDHGHREGHVVVFAIFSVFLTILLLIIRMLMTWASESNLMRSVAFEVAACVCLQMVTIRPGTLLTFMAGLPHRQRYMLLQSC